MAPALQARCQNGLELEDMFALVFSDQCADSLLSCRKSKTLGERETIVEKHEETCSSYNVQVTASRFDIMYPVMYRSAHTHDRISGML